jgi:CheY-like chemotaxis protein
VYDEHGELGPVVQSHLGEAEVVEACSLEDISGALRDDPAQAVLVNIAGDEDVRRQIGPIRQCSKATPVIACSVPRAWKRAEDSGALGYLTKPVSREDLCRVLQQVAGGVRRVLVVDDDPDACDLFSRMLRTCDGSLDVATADSGRAALSLLRREPPDLVLLDIVMDDMDGWEVIRRMQTDGSVPAVPTVFLSAQDPADAPLRSEFLLVAVDGGLPLGKLLQCSLDVSEALLSP